MRKFILVNAALSCFINCALPALTANRAVSAERLKLSFGIVERSISVDSLETYAKTGKVMMNWQHILNMFLKKAGGN